MSQSPQINRRYSVRAVIATGPGGVVYLAEDLLRPSEPLAFKVLPPGTFDESARHFEELARVTSLRHPNLNHVVDFGRIKRVAPAVMVPPRGPSWQRATKQVTESVPDALVPVPGSLFLASRFLTGGNLGEVLPQIIAAGMEPEQLDRWLSGVTLQVLRAVRFLHDLALLHFDIKPDHVLLADDHEYTPGVPHAYLIDLGLTARESTPLGNRVRGTFPYIAPEVLDRSIVDHRVDLYSLGATLYHALTGGLLLKDRSSEEIFAMVQHGQLPPPSELVPGLPGFWNDCILRLMQHDPEQRYPSAAGVIEQIRRRPAAAVMEDPPVLIGRSPRLVGQEKEFDYIARELERLKIGESTSTLILIHGEEGIGKRMTVRRLVELARLQGIEVFQSRCLGDGESPLDPIGRLLNQLRSHPLTPPSLYGEIEQLLRWLRDGIPPAEHMLPTLIERREDRMRMQGRIASLFNALDPAEAFFFVIEDLHLAAPELVECLALIAHRAHLERTAPAGRERGLELHVTETKGDGVEQERGGVRVPRTLILATMHHAPQGGRQQDATTRTFTVEALAREPHVARIALKPLSPQRSKELIREVLGPCHLPAGVYSELHHLSGGRWWSLLRLLRDCHRFGYLLREEHGWVWSDGEASPRLLEQLREEEWRRLSPDERYCLALVGTAGAMTEREMETVLADLEVRDPGATIDYLRANYWISRDDLAPQMAHYSLARTIPTPAAGSPDAANGREDEVARLFRSRAHFHLRQRPNNPLPAVGLFMAAGAWDELQAILPRAFEALREQHCDASLARLLERLREAGYRESEPDWILLEAQALFDLGLAAPALKLIEPLRQPGGLAATRMQALRLSGRLLAGQGKMALARRHLEDALQLAVEAGALEVESDVLLELGRLHLANDTLDKVQETADRATELLARMQHTGESMSDANAQAALVGFLAAAHLRQTLHQQGYELLQSFLQRARAHLSQPWLSRLLAQLGEVEFARGRYEESLEYFRSSLKVEESLRNYLRLATVEVDLGRIHYNRGEQELALSHYRRALRVREEIGDREGIAVCQNNIGLIYKNQNKLDVAETCFERCLGIFEQLGHTEKQAVALSNLSDCKMLQGDYGLALQYSLRGLEMRKSSTNRAGIGFSYHRIAMIYKTQGELALAADYAGKALAIRRDLGDKLGIATALLNLGELHLARGRYLDAFRAFQQSLHNFEGLGDRFNRQPLLVQLGVLCQLMGQYDEAEGYYDLSLEIASEKSLEYYTFGSLTARASLWVDQGSLSKAETDLNEAEKFFRRGPIRRELALVLIEKTRLALELGNHERALSILAETYSYIEQLGLHDLYPVYYRLRGGIAAAGDASELQLARKLLERGLEEAHKLEMPEESWRISYRLYKVEMRAGRVEIAQRHITNAHDTLKQLQAKLPTQFESSYLTTIERAELLAEWEAADWQTHQPQAEVTPARAAAPSAQDATPLSEHDMLRLQAMSLLLTTEQDLQKILVHIMQEVLELFQAERGYLILATGDQQEIRVARSIDREEVDGAQFKYSHSIADEVLRTGAMFITNDALNDERLRDAASVHDLRLQAIACFPLDWQGERLGVIYIENRFQKRLIEPERVRLVEAFSSQAAVAIINARLHSENQERRSQLEDSKRHIEDLNQRLSVRVEEQSRELEVTKRELRLRQDQLEDRFQFGNIIGRSAKMQALYQTLDRISKTDLPILIEGESGTGKELAARAIHYNSNRRGEVFVSENCGALAETLFESELFGHVKGAFTGADSAREGLFALAEGGTLFLDEVHELNFEMQKKLLRVLQDGEYRQVGGGTIRRANVRILSASNRPLYRLVQDGKFREDLYYRLNVLKVEMPPLRDRDQDVLILARHFLREVCEKENLGNKEYSPESLRLLAGYEYPGNVRELMNVVEKAAILSRSTAIEASDLIFDSSPVANTIAETISGGSSAAGYVSFVELPLREAKGQFERLYLQKILRGNEMIVSRAARKSGITRESFHRLLKRHGLARGGE